MSINIRAFLASAATATLLAACGGGGGPDAPPPGPAPAPAPPPAAVGIAASLQDVTVEEGDPASFSVGVSTSLPFVVQWRRGGVVIAGQTATTLTLPVATLADDGASFNARVTAGPTTVDGGTARLIVNLAAPAAPTGLSVLPGASGTSALLRWTDNSNNETGFEVIRVSNGQDLVVATVNPNQTTFTLTGLTPGASETLRVRALRSASNRTAVSTPTSATVTMPGGAAPTPAAPDNARLTLPNGVASAVDFAWDDNADNETGFEIFQVVSGSNVQIAVGNPNQATIRINGLAAGTTHTFRVRAVRTANGTTTRSGFASATITLPSAQNQIVTLTPTQDNVVRVNTFDPADNNLVLRTQPVEVGCSFIVDFGAAGSAAICSRSLLLFDLAAVSGRNIVRAELRLQQLDGAVTFTPVRDLRLGAILESWNPATVNGNTSLSLSATGVVTQQLSTVNVERAFDVTTIVRRWASGAQANNGFGIALANESIPTNLVTGAYAMLNVFASRENTSAANRPELMIEVQ